MKRDKALTAENHAFSTWNPIGDIIPQSWNNHLGIWAERGEGDKKRVMWRSRPHSQRLLARVIFLYTPTPILDAGADGFDRDPSGFERKFSGPYWQINYKTASRDLGVSVRTLKSEVDFLRDMGLIRTEEVPGFAHGSKSPPIYVVPVKTEIDTITYRVTNENRSIKGAGGKRTSVRSGAKVEGKSSAGAESALESPVQNLHSSSTNSLETPKTENPLPTVVSAISPVLDPKEEAATPIVAVKEIPSQENNVSEVLALAEPPPIPERTLRKGDPLPGWGLLTVANVPDWAAPDWARTLWVNIPCVERRDVKANLTPENTLVRPFAMIVDRSMKKNVFERPYDNSSEESRQSYQGLIVLDGSPHMPKVYMSKLDTKIAANPCLSYEAILADLFRSPYKGVRDPWELQLRISEERTKQGHAAGYNDLQIEIKNSRCSPEELELWLAFAAVFPKALFDIGQWRGKKGANTEAYKALIARGGHDMTMLLEEAGRIKERNRDMGYPLHPLGAAYFIKQANIALDN